MDTLHTIDKNKQIARKRKKIDCCYWICKHIVYNIQFYQRNKKPIMSILICRIIGSCSICKKKLIDYLGQWNYKGGQHNSI